MVSTHFQDHEVLVSRLIFEANCFVTLNKFLSIFSSYKIVTKLKYLKLSHEVFWEFIF